MSDVAVMAKSECSATTNVGKDVEDMELDESESAVGKNHCDDDEAEEGEISDSKDDDNPILENSGLSTLDFLNNHSRFGGVISGVDLFGREEQSKLEERARRFGLDQAVRAPTEQQLKELYDSLNMKLSEGLEKSYRLNALHMRGTEHLSTQDIFAYFKDYAPSFIEWIADYACNVVWVDELTAARALVGLSQRIAGLEAHHAKANPFHKKSEEASTEEEPKGVSGEQEEVVVVVAEIEGEGGENDIMVVDEQKENVADSHCSSRTGVEQEVAVEASSIEVPIPPGHWRKGVNHPKAKCILLRFATRSDKKVSHNEKLSEYYRKHGNPNYGGMAGIISASRKRRYQRESEFPAKVFDDDVGDERDFADSLCEDSKNPWGGLAQSWSRLDRTRCRLPDVPDEGSCSPPVLLPRKEISVTSASRREDRDQHRNANRPVFERLGTTRPSQARDSESEEPESSGSDDDHWTRRSKTPRMRMYADEEEDRLEQRRMLVRLQVSSKRPPPRSEDLRGRLERDGRSRTRMQDVAAKSPSTVWSRLRPADDTPDPPAAPQEDASSSSGSSSSDSDGDSSTSASESESGEGEEENGDDAGSDVPKTRSPRKDVVDLRSKLDMKKSLRQPASIRQKSPLRIEIDNDEYYRLIGSD